MIHKPAITSVKIDPTMQNRWSPRAFACNKPVDDSAINALLEAARWTPSCMNEQPWRFLICSQSKDHLAWQKLLTCLGEKNQLWAQHAPVLILSVAMNNFMQTNKLNRWASFDTGAACMSLCLQATALGLVTHQMGGFDADQCREVFDLPTDCSPLSIIAVGYQADPDHLDDEMKQKEVAERTRAELSKRFFYSRWEE